VQSVAFLLCFSFNYVCKQQRQKTPRIARIAQI
jgi:hypothetical protein